MKTQKQIQRETDPNMLLATRYRQLCEMGITRTDLVNLIRYSPERYQCFAYLLDHDGWQDMSQLNH